MSIMFTSRIYPAGGSVLSAMPLFHNMYSNVAQVTLFSAQIIQKLIQLTSLKLGIMKRELEFFLSLYYFGCSCIRPQNS